MYTIILLLSGKFQCLGKLQDSTERWQCDTLEEAVKTMKQHARFGNGTKIKRKHITFLQEQPVTQVKCVPWEPFPRRRNAYPVRED